MDRKEIEIQIINLTEKLVQAAIEGGDLEKHFPTVEELRNLIIELLGDEKHLESMLRQLISQKIPNKNLLDSFGNFSSNLDKLIEMGIKGEMEEKIAKINFKNNWGLASKYIKINKKAYFRKENKGEKVFKSELEILLNSLFPETKIYKNYFFHGFKLEYYLPEKKLAVEVTRRTSGRGIKEYLCDKEGIVLLKICPTKKNNLNYIKKLLKTSLE